VMRASGLSGYAAEERKIQHLGKNLCFMGLLVMGGWRKGREGISW